MFAEARACAKPELRFGEGRLAKADRVPIRSGLPAPLGTTSMPMLDYQHRRMRCLSRRSLLAGLTAGTAVLAAGRTARAACALTAPQTEGPFFPTVVQDHDWDLTHVSGGSGRATGEVIEVTGGNFADLINIFISPITRARKHADPPAFSIHAVNRLAHGGHGGGIVRVV